MNSQTEAASRLSQAPRFRPPLERVQAPYRGKQRCDTASGAVATVMVAHSIPLIAAGMASMLARQPRLEVRIWDETQGPWRGHRLHGVDFVFADSECLRRSGWHDCTAAPDHAAAPRVIWVTTVSDDDAPSPSKLAGISAQLPVQCGEKALFEALENLTECLGTIGAPAPKAKPTGGLAPGALRRVKAHIEQHLAERIELVDLARLAGLSECHFSRAFKQSVGVPPHRFLMSRRITLAAELVSKTDRALSEIALDVGFCDQSHFTRLFSAMVGETPSAFRRRHR